MKSIAAKWFVFGIVFGMGSLLGALHLSPGVGPRTATAEEKAATVELTKLMKRMNTLLETVSSEFVEPSCDARAAALSCDLQTIRSQIELWKLQHLDVLPGNVPGVTLQEQLTCKTNQDGKLSPAGPYGPYLQMFPKNPYTDTDTVNTDGPTNGWVYDPKTGEFTADNVPKPAD